MIKAFYTLILLCLCVCAHADVSLIDKTESLKSCLVKVNTIYIRTIKTGSTERVVTYTRTGVGIVLDPSGIIVTNTHTIVNAPRIIVILNDGTRYPAQVGFVANGRDFSFLKIDPPKPLKAIRWGDSERLSQGDPVLTIGAAAVDTNTILSGEITALIQNNRSGQIEMLETNLNLYKGDSGGPIIDRQGRLIGMVMGKIKNQERVSMAIAADIIHQEFIAYKNTQQ